MSQELRRVLPPRSGDRGRPAGRPRSARRGGSIERELVDLLPAGESLCDPVDVCRGSLGSPPEYIRGWPPAGIAKCECSKPDASLRDRLKTSAGEPVAGGSCCATSRSAYREGRKPQHLEADSHSQPHLGATLWSRSSSGDAGLTSRRSSGEWGIMVGLLEEEHPKSDDRFPSAFHFLSQRGRLHAHFAGRLQKRLILATSGALSFGNISLASAGWQPAGGHAWT